MTPWKWSNYNELTVTWFSPRAALAMLAGSLGGRGSGREKQYLYCFFHPLPRPPEEPANQAMLRGWLTKNYLTFVGKDNSQQLDDDRASP